jgi:hypothetical protein
LGTNGKKATGILDIENRNNQVNQEQNPDAQMVFLLIRVQNDTKDMLKQR